MSLTAILQAEEARRFHVYTKTGRLADYDNWQEVVVVMRRLNIPVCS